MKIGEANRAKTRRSQVYMLHYQHSAADILQTPSLAPIGQLGSQAVNPSIT